jgi:hypothetical protein
MASTKKDKENQDGGSGGRPAEPSAMHASVHTLPRTLQLAGSATSRPVASAGDADVCVVAARRDAGATPGACEHAAWCRCQQTTSGFSAGLRQSLTSMLLRKFKPIFAVQKEGIHRKGFKTSLFDFFFKLCLIISLIKKIKNIIYFIMICFITE